MGCSVRLRSPSLWDPQGWLLALALSALGWMISVLEAAEMGVLIDWLGPCVAKQYPKKNYS